MNIKEWIKARPRVTQAVAAIVIALAAIVGYRVVTNDDEPAPESVQIEEPADVQPEEEPIVEDDNA